MQELNSIPQIVKMHSEVKKLKSVELQSTRTSKRPMICGRVKKIEKYNESNYIVRFTPEELGGLQKGHACFWEITKGGSPQPKLVFKFI